MKKAVFNWSGGKDSALALWKALQTGEYDIVALLTTVNQETERSSMHAIPVSLLEKQAERIGIPLYVVEQSATSTMDEYSAVMQRAAEHFTAQGVTHFIFGDIYLQDLLEYRQRQLAPYGITVVEPLWSTSEEVMEEFLRSGIRSVIVTTTADVLGREYIGRAIDRQLVDSLPAGVDVCGENGEYHSFCYDGPFFKAPVPYTLGEPYQWSCPIRKDDGQEYIYWYWSVDLNG
ncbi:MAG: diphthine--ammonia ligase [Mediterranea sp.]|jgi:uncharacterized protein (TIGR00290 family)|nr:diphthine--ammonia ligase [Mediterranea sp.]